MSEELIKNRKHLISESIEDIKNKFFYLAKPSVAAFDLDNTLHNLIDFYEYHVNLTREYMGLESWNDEDFREFFKDGYISNHDSFSRMFGNKADIALKYYYDIFHQSKIPENRVLDGVKFMLYRLKFIYKIPIIGVTNLEQHMAKKALRDLKLFGFFDSVTGPKGNRKLKPEKELLLIGLAKINMNTSKSVWLTGDSEIDTKCAKDAGATAIRFYESIKPEDPNADLFCNSHYLLEKIFGTILGYYK